MVIDGELLLAEAAWRGDVVHLRGDERAVERLRFMLALDDDLAPFHRAFRGDPLLGRVHARRSRSCASCACPTRSRRSRGA